MFDINRIDMRFTIRFGAKIEGGSHVNVYVYDICVINKSIYRIGIRFLISK